MKFMKCALIVCMLFLVGYSFTKPFIAGTINGRSESLVSHHETNPDTGIRINQGYYVFHCLSGWGLGIGIGMNSDYVWQIRNNREYWLFSRCPKYVL